MPRPSKPRGRPPTGQRIPGWVLDAATAAYLAGETLDEVANVLGLTAPGLSEYLRSVGAHVPRPKGYRSPHEPPGSEELLELADAVDLWRWERIQTPEGAAYWGTDGAY